MVSGQIVSNTAGGKEVRFGFLTVLSEDEYYPEAS